MGRRVQPHKATCLDRLAGWLGVQRLFAVSPDPYRHGTLSRLASVCRLTLPRRHLRAAITTAWLQVSAYVRR